MNIFVINGHKYYWYSTGKLNNLLFEEIISTLKDTHNIRYTILEHGYKTEEEIEKYKWADIIIYQNPINWFSVPWILKKYFDEIFQAGVFFQHNKNYGEGGLLCGKKYMFSLTCASKESDFINSNSFFDMRTIDEIYISQHKMHQFCCMEKLQTFCAYDVVHNPQIDRLKDRLRFHLNKNIK